MLISQGSFFGVLFYLFHLRNSSKIFSNEVDNNNDIYSLPIQYSSLDWRSVIIQNYS
jgi:hypothetical protein